MCYKYIRDISVRFEAPCLLSECFSSFLINDIDMQRCMQYSLCCFMYSVKLQGELALKISSVNYRMTFKVAHVLLKHEGHVFGNEKKNVCILDNGCQAVLHNQRQSF